MPATVRVSAGDKVYVGGTITETTGKDITGCTVVVAALPRASRPDADTQGAAPDVDEHPTTSQRLVKLLITDTTPVGNYQLWARITDNPEQEWLPLTTFDCI